MAGPIRLNFEINIFPFNAHVSDKEFPQNSKYVFIFHEMKLGNYEISLHCHLNHSIMKCAIITFATLL